MSVSVPLIRPSIGMGDVVTAAPVRGPTTWVDFSKACNWTLGRGSMLVPIHSPLVTLTNGSEHIFAYRTRPRYQAIERKLLVRLRGSTATTAAVEFQSGATARTIRVATDREGASTELFTESLGAQSETEGEVTWAVTPNAANVVVEGVAMWEVARSKLEIATANDRGTDPTRLASGQPITRVSLEGGFNTVSGTSAMGRRAAFLQWAVPYSVGGATSTAFAKAVTSTSYVGVFASGVPMLARMLNRSATTGSVRLKALCWVTGGSADIRFNSSVHGASSAVNVTATTPTWSSALDFSIDCEDPSEPDGLRGAAFDMVQIEARKNVNGTLYISSVSVWEN